MIKILHIARTERYHPTFRNFIESLFKYEHIVVSTTEPVSLRSIFNIKYTKLKLKALTILMKMRPDIIIVREYFGLPFGLFITFIAKMLRIKTVAIPDIPEYALPKFSLEFANIIKILRYPLYVIHAHILDAIVCFTEYEVKTLLKLHASNEKIMIIPWGCDLNFGTIPRVRRNYILSLAAWSDRKNLHTILKVFSEILKEIDVDLYVAGRFCDDKYKNKIMGIARDLKVNFLGFIPDSKKCNLMKHAKIFYLPSKMETLGRVYIEAMASGTPIVAMKNSAVQYVVKDGVTGFLRNDEEGQKEAILRLLTDERLYKEMQKNCLKEAESYKWENVARKWESLIEGLVGIKNERKKG